jgi:hypothetical protein
MPILRDIPIALTAQEVVEAQKTRRRRRSHSSPAMIEAAQQALDLAQPLCESAATYAEFQVKTVDKEQVTVALVNGREKEQVLKIGPHTDLLAQAERLLVAVYTIGPDLGARVDQLAQEGDALTAFWLDSVGVLSLGAIGETMRCIAEEKAAERGWGLSPALSPGSLVGWPLKGQRELCALLPLAEIGVELNRYCVLVPHKSVSVVIGMGPGFESHKVGSVCRFCALADSCWRRK